MTKLSPAGSTLVYSTYLGGSGDDGGSGIAVDAGGNAYVTGVTGSTDFPTANPAQPALAGSGGTADAFVTKLNATGSGLVYSTYLGGSQSEIGFGIAVDASGNAYVTGFTTSIDFPTVNPVQPALSGEHDAFVAKLSPAGSTLVYSTYLGGGGEEEEGFGIAVDAAGSAYIVGRSESPNFPTTPGAAQSASGGAFDAFVAKIADINTPVGTNVAVQSVDLATGTTPVTLTFSAVAQQGVTTLVTSGSGPTPPAGFQLVSPATFYDLTTTAVFSGSVTVCITHGGVTAASRLFHFEGGRGWIARALWTSRIRLSAPASARSRRSPSSTRR